MSVDVAIVQELASVDSIPNGIEWLNANHLGWRDRIDINELDISSSTNCVFGQLGEDFDEFREEHDLTVEECADMGFTINLSGDLEDVSTWHMSRAYDLLTEAWRKVLS